MFKPAVSFLQETKVSRKGQFKLPGYEILEVTRQNNAGGSILTAIHKNLEPILICDEEISDTNIYEILVVQAKFANYMCQFIRNMMI